VLVYWAVMALIPAPGFSAGNFTPQGNLAGYIDRLILPNPNAWCCYGYGDSEGLLSTIPAISTCLFGVLTGNWLRSEKTPQQKLGGLFTAGFIMIAIALLWNLVFPINKYLWTSSFVFATGGISVLLVGIFYGIIDVLGWKRWTIFFTIIGMNSILIYMLHDFIAAILIIGLVGWIIKGGYKKIWFWIIIAALIVATVVILITPAMLDAITVAVAIVSNDALLLAIIDVVYGYLCLVWCYKRKLFVSPENAIKLIYQNFFK
jgi:predicted acyltransferase